MSALVIFALSFAAAGEPLVDAARIPGVVVDLRYATPDNFTKQAVYPPHARCLLRASVVERLERVAHELAARRLRLKLWDCYRPRAVQERFWRLVPDERYVANPKKGSRHNRAAAVDLTLVDADGRELDMGTPFDEFGERAHRDYTKLSEAARANRALLEAAMRRQGFVPMPTEWWHFDAPDWASLPLLDEKCDQ
jgi:D-alanyl-D-alanine dipeptidase